MIQGEALDFVQRNEDARKEGLVFFLEGKSKTVDDGTEDFEKLGNAIMSFRLVNEVEENIINGTTNESAEVEEFSIDAVEGSLEEIAFTGVFRVKEFEEIEDKGLVNVSFGKICVKVGTLDKSEEEFIDNLKMGPCELEHRLVLFWVERVTCWVYGGRDRAEEICCKLMMAQQVTDIKNAGGATHHVDNFGIDVLSDDAALCRDILEHLVKGLCLDLLALELCARVIEVEKDATLVEFFDEQLRTLVGGSFWWQSVSRDGDWKEEKKN